MLSLISCIYLILSNFVYLQFDPELVIVSSGYDAAIGDAEVTFALIVITRARKSLNKPFFLMQVLCFL